LAQVFGRVQTLDVIQAKGAAVSDESEREHARMADEARREAYQAAERATVEAERAKTEVLTGETAKELVRQQGLIYGGLIGIAVVMIQPFLTAASLDVSAKICVIAFAVAIPLLAALVMVNRHEVFRQRKTPSILVTVAQVIAQATASVGVVAGFWHINWVAGVCLLATGIVAVGIHSAGFWRLEVSRQPAS
jgi:uncharacterized membrane protein